MSDLLAASWLGSLQTTGDSTKDQSLVVFAREGGEATRCEIDDTSDIDPPLSESEYVEIGERSFALYDGLTISPSILMRSADFPAGPCLWISLEENYLTEQSDEYQNRVQSESETLIELIDEIATSSSPRFLAVNPVGPREREDLPTGNDYSDAIGYSLDWVNFLADDVVATVGRETLLSAPVYESRELSNGILLRMYETMADPDPDPGRRLRAHLGLN